jgi:hypothetical protein
MKRTLAVVLLLFSALAWAGSDPNPADYTINVHVSASRVKNAGITLTAIVDGKKSELLGNGALLIPGDYKAKLIRNDHKNAYEIYQVYEFLFPDKKTRTYTLIGIME